MSKWLDRARAAKREAQASNPMSTAVVVDRVVSLPNDTIDTNDTRHGGIERNQAPRLVEHNLETLIAWFLSTRPTSSPIQMSPTDAITDPSAHWRYLRQLALAGNRPRQLDAELWRDLARLHELLSSNG